MEVTILSILLMMGGVSRHKYNGSNPNNQTDPTDFSHWEDLTGQFLNTTQYYGMDVSTKGDIVLSGSIDNGTDIYQNGIWVDYSGSAGGGDGGVSGIDPIDSRVLYMQQFQGFKNLYRRSSVTNISDNIIRINTKGSVRFRYPLKIRQKNRDLFVATGHIGVVSNVPSIPSIPPSPYPDDLHYLPTSESTILKPISNIVATDSDLSQILNFDIFDNEDDPNDSEVIV